jgi:hypothetical protein
LNGCQNDFYVWNSFEIPKILHENNSLSKTKSSSYSLIPKPELNTWGHDQSGGQIKMHGTVGSIIPLLRKMPVKIGNP